MQLIIGGYAQGKLEYVQTLLADQGKTALIYDERSFRELSEPKEPVVINHVHLIIREFPDPTACLAWFQDLIHTCETEQTELYLIANELGSGLIPATREDRTYREDAGRLLCQLAKDASQVIRIICGIPCRIK